MKFFAVLVVLALALSACNRHGPPILAHKRPVDLVRIALGHGGDVCSDPDKPINLGSGNAIPTRQAIPDEQCYWFGPSTRMHGVWYDEFEYSRYFDGADKLPENHHYSTDDTLFDVDPVSLPPVYGNCHRSFVIDFVGRHTLLPGPYGDVGDIVIVDKVIAMRELPPGPGILLKKSSRQDPRYGLSTPSCAGGQRQH